MSLKDKTSVLNGVMADLQDHWAELDAAWPDFTCHSDGSTEQLSMVHTKALEVLPLVRAVNETSANLLDNLNHVCGILYGITTGRSQLRQSTPNNPGTLEVFEKLLFELIRTKNVTLKTYSKGSTRPRSSEVVITGLEVRDHDMKAPG